MELTSETVVVDFELLNLTSKILELILELTLKTDGIDLVGLWLNFGVAVYVERLNLTLETAGFDLRGCCS